MNRLSPEVRNAALFQGIEEKNLSAMLDCLGGHFRSYRRGEFLSFEEEELQQIGIVLSGTVHMLKSDFAGNKTILAVIPAGQLFGETFACGRDTRAVVAFQAAADTEVLLLPFRRVLQTCSASCVFHQQMIENMVLLLAEKNRQLMEKVEVTSKRTLREKILAYLKLQSEQAGSAEFDLPLDRAGLADYLFADRSALSRELSAMQSDGLLEYEKNHFLLKI